MSALEVRKVMEHSQADPVSVRKNILITIASYIGEDGSPCFVSQETIARVAHTSRVSVRKCVEWAEENGELEVDRSSRRIYMGLGSHYKKELSINGDDPINIHVERNSETLVGLSGEVSSIRAEIAELRNLMETQWKPSENPMETQWKPNGNPSRLDLPTKGKVEGEGEDNNIPSHLSYRGTDYPIYEFDGTKAKKAEFRKGIKLLAETYGEEDVLGMDAVLDYVMMSNFTAANPYNKFDKGKRGGTKMKDHLETLEMLLEGEYKPEDVIKFGWREKPRSNKSWWFLNKGDGTKLKSTRQLHFIGNMGNPKSKTKTAHQGNPRPSHSDVAEKSWDLVYNVISRKSKSHYDGKDRDYWLDYLRKNPNCATMIALRAIGGLQRLLSMRSSDLPFVKKDYIKAYIGAKSGS